MLKTFTLLAFLTITQIAIGKDVAQQCAEDVIALMQEDKNTLAHKAVKMIKAYNKTCDDLDLCQINLSEDTASYLNDATLEEDEPELPEVPIEGTAVVDFGAFVHETYTDYVDECRTRGGFVKFYDVTANLEGTAMDLVDMKVFGAMTSFPACLVKSCADIDPVEALEYAVKHAILANAPEITDQQKTLINGMSTALACAASGIEICELKIVDSDDLTLSAFSSGSVVGLRALVTLLGVWFAVV